MHSTKLARDRASGLSLLIVVVTYKNPVLLLIFPPRGVFVFVPYDDIQCSSNPVCHGFGLSSLAHLHNEGHFLIYDSPLYSLTTPSSIRLLVNISHTISYFSTRPHIHYSYILLSHLGSSDYFCLKMWNVGVLN